MVRCPLLVADPRLLVDPRLGVILPLERLVGEPEADLTLGSVDSVRAVADIPPNINGIVATNGARSRLGRLGGTEDNPACSHDAIALPYHGNDGARGHVAEEGGEEGLLDEVLVVLLEELLISLHHLEGHELEPLLLKPLDDVTDEAALDSVRLDHDEGLLTLLHLEREGTPRGSDGRAEGGNGRRAAEREGGGGGAEGGGTAGGE
mmetsp:Transcript_17593/g.44457  ORF Transcript_17593/g.44457 Transcript_17593/m.44457 type:complete len:206 (-) Transcript_17593:96-713(-)